MSREEIISANPIADFLRNRGHELKRAGKNFVTNASPVTQHKRGHRPVMIYPENNGWYDHGLKLGGSVIDWLMHERGCDAVQAMRELGGNNGATEIVATYDYTDEGGNLLFQCVRTKPKDFWQRRPDGKGGWINNLQGVRRVLYRLPEVKSAQTVCVAEGEKDANNLAKLGFVATTNPLGAGKWRDEHSETLRGKDVFVFGDVGDDDGAGEKHTQQVIESLTGKAKSIKHVALPDGFHDVSDYIASLPHETVKRAAIQKLIDETPLIDQARTAQPEPKHKNDEATIARLAALSPIEYDRIRKDEAKRLECRESTLDSQVQAKRPLMRPSASDNLQGEAVIFTDIEPCPEPVNGAEVLDQISKTFSSYVVQSPQSADTAALWSAHTHCYSEFQCSPRLYVTSPQGECGKTTLRDLIGLFSSRPQTMENLTVAVLFRLTSAYHPTILADECDKWINDNEELSGLFNAGHRKGGRAFRIEGDTREVRAFDAYAPAVLCGLNRLPGTLPSRSIVIRLERARKDEKPKRFDLRHVLPEIELGRKLARWIADTRDRIASCDPQLPEAAFNRVADNWRPLFAIAEVAGGDWPKRCLGAFEKLTRGESEDVESLRVMLLSDIREVFKTERMFTKDLVEALAELKERPWPEVSHGKPITARWLARNLDAFGVHSGNIRIGEDQAKGYERAQFDDVFARYIPESPEGGNLAVPPSHTEVKPENSIRPTTDFGTDEKKPVYEALGRWDGSKGGKPGKGDKVI